MQQNEYARSSLVMGLGLIALLLFTANFYQFVRQDLLPRLSGLAMTEDAGCLNTERVTVHTRGRHIHTHRFCRDNRVAHIEVRKHAAPKLQAPTEIRIRTEAPLPPLKPRILDDGSSHFSEMRALEAELRRLEADLRMEEIRLRHFDQKLEIPVVAPRVVDPRQ